MDFIAKGRGNNGFSLLLGGRTKRVSEEPDFKYALFQFPSIADVLLVWIRIDKMADKSTPIIYLGHVDVDDK